MNDSSENTEKRKSGQSLLEYILLSAVVIAFVIAFKNVMLGDKLSGILGTQKAYIENRAVYGNKENFTGYYIESNSTPPDARIVVK